MKPVNLDPIIQNDEQYSKLSETLTAKYNCDWEDSVHESYGLYVRKIKDCAGRLKRVRSKAETLEKELANLKIDALIKSGETLCREAEAL